MGRRKKEDGQTVEQTDGETGAVSTVEPQKKERTGFYMVMGCNGNGQPIEVLKIINTIGRAEKWLDENKTLVSRLYPMASIIRCKPVPPRGIDMVQV